ncbi:arginine/serine-rich protein 1 isoform X2 [Salvelinus sp. IW2-2015]|nr:arginine/serine-rich protein 1 isoform X2 [Salvelinus alpinus]XP_023842239.1 arginine/serine-rich protein 1 isoform X2 [Salvelinus alpinus]XP_023842240.1 arginine/serine-rich protein 1 isoform X2 [Salvelinus alpinus]
MKTDGKDSHVQMTQAPQSERISLIFDQDAQSSSSCSRYPSRSSHTSSQSSGSRRQVKRNNARRVRHRSSTSSSSSRSSHSSNSSPRTRPRSRSHPRCHRASSSSRCCRQHRQANGHRRHRSPSRCYRAHSRSYSPSSSPDRPHRHSSRSRSASWSRVHRGFVGRYKCRFSGSPNRSHKTYTSRPTSSGRSVVSLSIEEKGELRTTKANTTQVLGMEQLDVPESVKPILEEQQLKTRLATPEPEEWVRPEPLPQKSLSQQNSDIEPEDAPSPNMSPKKKMISFSIHNSVAKPTAIVASTTSKVAHRVENYTASRNPFGHWVPVRKTVHSSFCRTLRKH